MRYVLALVLMLASVLSAQTRVETRTTTKTSWNGTLVDANCQRTHTERRKIDSNSRAATTTRTEVINCPVTQETRSFGLVTSDGRFIRFDDPSNTRVIEIVRTNRDMGRFLADRSPLRVSVVGAANGDIAIVESVSPDDASTVTSKDIIFDVRHDGDRGKLVLTSQGINFENLSDAKHSRRWTYSEIKEFKREGADKIEIESDSGHDFEFRVEGAGMSETVYKMAGDRIAAARSR